MKPHVLIFLCLSILWLATGSARATEQTRQFLDAVEQYHGGNYQGAIDAFATIAATGINNGELFYNLGNAHLKNGSLGHAILWYERALRLTPDDPDLKFNHEFAVSLTKDRTDESASSLWRILFFWHDILSPGAVRWLAILSSISLWGLLLVRALGGKRPLIKAPAYVLLIALLIFSGSAIFQYYQQAIRTAGIILPVEASVRSGLSDQSTELFILHAGTRVVVVREKEDFYRIAFSEGKIGWLPKTAVGII